MKIKGTIDTKFKLWLEGEFSKDKEGRLMETHSPFMETWRYNEKTQCLESNYGACIYLCMFGGYEIEDEEVRIFDRDDDSTPYMVMKKVVPTEKPLNKEWLNELTRKDF